MALNISARPYQVILYKHDLTNPLNVTAFCSGVSDGYFVANESEPDENGIITTTGKLVLDVMPGFHDSSGWNTITDNGYSGYDVFQPDLNIERWAVGSFVMVYVAKDSEIQATGNRLGTTPLYSLHPKGRMRILEKPLPPTRKNLQLEISIGDDLTLLNWRTPDDDRSGVQLGTQTSRTTIISNILAAAGITSFTGSVGSYPLKNPIVKTGGSLVEQAGRVAFGGKKWLWQNNEGEITTTEFNPQPVSVFKLITLGQNEVDYEPLSGEKPCSEVIVAGTGYDLDNQPEDEGTQITTESLPKAAFGAINLNSSSATYGQSLYPNDASPCLSSETTENWYWTDNQFIRNTVVKEARGLVISDGFYKSMTDTLGITVSPTLSPFTLIVSSIKTETETYDQITGFLIKKTSITDRPIGAVSQEYFQQIASNSLYSASSIANTDFLEIVTTETEEVTYSYKGTQTRRIETQRKELLAAITGSSPDWADNTLIPPDEPFVLIPSEITTEEWSPARNIIVINGQDNPSEEWRKVEKTRQAGVTTGGIQVMASLFTTSNIVRRTNNGQDQPPAANTKKPDQVTTEKEYRGVANLEPLNEFDSAPRSRTYRIDYPVSNQQCDEIAEILAAILAGRHQGFTLTVAFDDTWFNYQPLSRIDVINQLDITSAPIRLVGATSGTTFVLGADKAIVTVNCLRLGTTNVDC